MAVAESQVENSQGFNGRSNLFFSLTVSEFASL